MGEKVSRRAFIGTAAAAGLTGAVAGPAQAQTPSGTGKAAQRRSGLPGRGEFTVRNAYVLSMDPALGDVPGGDVHVRNGRIVAVGRNVRGGGKRIDGRNMIVMPGLIDTHWHLWTTLHRSMATAGGLASNGYFGLNVRLGAVMRPGDIRQGVRLSVADAIGSGVTTVHDWSHNIRGPEFADANLKALVESGIRARFSYGTPQGHPVDTPMDLADLQRVDTEWFRSGRTGGLIRLGVAGRPPGLAPASVYRAEYAKARELGLPVSYHANSNRAQGNAAMIQKLANEGMLGGHVQLIHALYTTAEERRLIAETGTPVSVSPWSELLVGYGVTPIRDLARAGALLNLSVDTTPLTGTADMFSIMRLTMGLDRGQAERELNMTARRVLEMATVDAAKGLGIDDQVGSLAAGKRADLIMVRSDDVNVAPFIDAPNAVALAAGPQNVDTVVIDGRILKRHGLLTAMNARDVVADAQAALRRVRARAEAPAARAAAASASAAASRGHADACCG
jgi:cytosine/adenosine deaminase-related metal-dependent hydrolase